MSAILRFVLFVLAVNLRSPNMDSYVQSAPSHTSPAQASNSHVAVAAGAAPNYYDVVSAAPAPTPYPLQQYTTTTLQYPRNTGHVPPEEPYIYPPPPPGYPPQQGHSAPQFGAAPPPQQLEQQQKQQRVILVRASSQRPVTTVGHVDCVESFVAHIVFACLVFWCCNCLFGLIAFILAS